MRTARAAVLAATASALALTAHTAWNLRHLRRAPRATGDQPTSRVEVLVPARDEAHRIDPCVTALLAQDHPDLHVTVLDDNSSDGTGDLVRARVGHDPRFVVIEGRIPEPPPGWLGKPWACHVLAETALLQDPRPELLIFVDADVELAPDAVRRIDALMARSGLDLASPYPRQQALTPAERLVQPLLQWSWLTTLPLKVAEGSPRPSLTAANGQVLALRSRTHDLIGGHRAVRGDVLEDLGLARAVKAAGGRATVTDGTDLATCRMYTSATDLIDGYTKSLWAAFGSRSAAAGSAGLLTFVYVLPPAAMLLARTNRTRAIAALGYAAGVAGRLLVARRTGARLGDAWAHPFSITALAWLITLSWWRRSRGELTWKGRAIFLPGTPI